jgi:hypothetical protein
MTTPSAALGVPRSPVDRQYAGCGAVMCLVASVLGVLGLLLGSALPASAATPPAAAHPAGRVTFGIEPASASGPDGRPNFSFVVTPGAVLFDHAAVVNYSSIPLTLQVYATDATETAGGGFGLLLPTVKPTGAGAWISLPAGTSTVQVPAERATGPGFVVFPITVHVPASATPGDHSGGIIASLRTVGTNGSGQTVILNQRIASRVYIRVAGTLVPRLAITGLHATYSGTANPVGKGKVSVHYVVANTGNVNLAVRDQRVSVTGLIDDSHHVKVSTIQLLLPGATVNESAVVTGEWPQFILHPTVSAVPLANETVTVALAPVSASTTLWAIPWTLIIIVLVLVALAGYWWRRRRRSRAAAGQSPAPGDGMTSDLSAESKVPA